MRKVTIRPHQQEWATQFHLEAIKLMEILQSHILAIHHIGSTAVPGLYAKPIIDIMPIVQDITRIDEYNEAMIELGYEPRGENGIEGRRYFQKGADNRTHHVHIYEEGNKEIHRHLVFRDYLRVHPDEARKYSRLKMKLAELYPSNIDSYIKGKHSFVIEIEKKALLWHEKWRYKGDGS